LVAGFQRVFNRDHALVKLSGVFVRLLHYVEYSLVAGQFNASTTESTVIVLIFIPFHLLFCYTEVGSLGNKIYQKLKRFVR
jgi:hypothetical protein